MSSKKVYDAAPDGQEPRKPELKEDDEREGMTAPTGQAKEKPDPGPED